MSKVQKPLAYAPQESKFLSVPGEIRNYIYSFCVEPIDVVPRSGRADLLPMVPGQEISSGDYELYYDCRNPPLRVVLQPSTTRVDYHTAGIQKRSLVFSIKRQFFALTQVCRQVRLEYVPIYRRALHVNIWLPDLTAFINTFYPLDQSNNSVLGYEGRITVQVPSAVHSYFDLTPLLDLRRHAPKLQFDFDASSVSSGFIRDLNRFFSPSSPQPSIKPSGRWYCVGTERVRYPRLLSVSIRLLRRLPNTRWSCAMKVIFNKKDYRPWMNTPKLQGYTFRCGYERCSENAIAPERHVEEAMAVGKELGLKDCESSWLVEFGVNEVVD